jgi:hypothetical protein
VSSGEAHVRWNKGGGARVTSADDDRVELVSTIPSAPGSRLEGAIESGTKVRVKVARCRRIGGAEDPVSYGIEGRLIDASRSVRDEIAKLATGSAAAEGDQGAAPAGDRSQR